MEKRISYSQFQQVKSAAKMINPNIQKIEALKKKIMPLVAEMQQYQALNASLEEGIVKVIGFHVTDLVKKVIEPTGAVGKDGKPIKVTKYLPTDMVSYDEQKKEYVIHIPSSDEINTQVDTQLAEESLTPETSAAEPAEDPNALPFEEEAEVASPSGEVTIPSESSSALSWE